MFRNHRIKVPDKQLSPNLNRLLLIGRGLINANGLPIQTDTVHDARGILGVLFADELDKTIALVSLSNPVFREMDVDDAAGLEHEFPY